MALQVHLRVPHAPVLYHGIEIEDNKVFFIHIEGEKSPVAAFFYKIQVSNEGNESKKDYPDLEREVLELSKNNIKKIVFK